MYAPCNKEPDSDSRPTADVVTVVDSTLQNRLTLVLVEIARPVHVTSVSAALSVVRERPVRAVLLGEESITTCSAPALGKLAVSCGGPLIAVVGGWTPALSDTLLAFGRYGVREAVDVSSRGGLCRLRDLIVRVEWELANRVARALEPGLQEASKEMQVFMNYVVRAAPLVGSVTALAAGLGILPSSLTSRFFRAGLPSPKQYLAYIRLLFAAALLEQPNFSAAQVARRLNYSSSQSFIRHLRVQLGLTASEFRTRSSFEALAHHVAYHALSRHRTSISGFKPLGTIILGKDDRSGVS